MTPDEIARLVRPPVIKLSPATVQAEEPKMRWGWNNMTFVPYADLYGLIVGTAFFGYAKFRNLVAPLTPDEIARLTRGVP